MKFAAPHRTGALGRRGDGTVNVTPAVEGEGSLRRAEREPRRGRTGCAGGISSRKASIRTVRRDSR
jgi:hypothetical protein